MEGSEGLIKAFGEVQSELINYTRVVLVDDHGVFLSMAKKGRKQRNMNSLWCCIGKEALSQGAL